MTEITDNNSTVTINQAKDIIRSVIDYNLELAKQPKKGWREYIIPQLISNPGSGKTAICKEIAEKADVEFEVFCLTQMDPLVIAGIKFFDWDERSMFTTKPEWVKTEGRWLILCDEFAQATMMAKNIMGEPLNEHRIGPYKLSEEATIILASNKQTNRAGTSPTPSQIRDRVLNLYIEPSFDEWKVDALNNGVRTEITNYLSFQPKHFNSFDPDNESSGTLRSWTKVSEILDMGLTGHALHCAIQGQIGPGLTTSFKAFLDVWQSLPSFSSIVNDPKGTEVPDPVTEPAVLYAVCGMITGRVDKKTMTPVMQYIRRLPDEYKMMCIKDCVDKDRSLLKVPAVMEWKMTEGKKLVLTYED